MDQEGKDSTAFESNGNACEPSDHKAQPSAIPQCTLAPPPPPSPSPSTNNLRRTIGDCPLPPPMKYRSYIEKKPPKLSQRHPVVSDSSSSSIVSKPGEASDSKQASIKCRLCLNESPEETMVRCSACPATGHSCCRSCLSRFWEITITSDRIKSLTCLGSASGSCGNRPTAEDIKGVAGERVYKRYMYFMRKKLFADENVVFCAKDSCWEPIFLDAAMPPEIEEDIASVTVPENYAKCLSCFSYTCQYCSSLIQPYECTEDSYHTCQPFKDAQEKVHPAVQAQVAERGFLARWFYGQSGNDEDAPRKEPAEAQIELFHKTYVGTVVIKNCPLCKVLIERSEGCDSMQCTRCNFTFCWSCLKSRGNQLESTRIANAKKAIGGLVRSLIVARQRKEPAPLSNVDMSEEDLLLLFATDRNVFPSAQTSLDVVQEIGVCSCSSTPDNQFQATVRTAWQVVADSLSAIGGMLASPFSKCYQTVADTN